MTLAEALIEWERYAPKRWEELRRERMDMRYVNHSSYLAPEASKRSREITTAKLAKDAVAWFKFRGHDVTCELNPDKEGFKIYGPRPLLALTFAPGH
ncbi:hypothetical protein UFOVP783_119 [uncultured Caudovirales phage]|uniref:Uncharacterized protein n=1 Tax=uncultured Caudovirales phage TaxID=2100421 RepID=A0A6J5P5I0_9CAUD|nr:hypothetical protein UFOVP783_119 [uncultured Caudovirales phage]